MDQTTRIGRWRKAISIYRRPTVLAMLFLGFSAGLPFMLVFATLSAWLREMEVSRSAIGFFSWVGITYSIKFIWSPVVDRLPVPGLTRALGRRRSWILLGQIGIATGLAGMAFADPQVALLPVALLALLVAFSSATQDVAIDAFRIESDIDRHQAALAAAYQLGYRVAILASYTGALYLADLLSWRIAYLSMAGLMGIGMLTVLLRPEPVAEQDRAARGDDARARAFVARHPGMPAWLRATLAWLLSAVVAPVREFFARFGRFALVMLALVASFRITDIAMASMANPLYIDLGYSKAVIANISGAWGLGMTILGALLGGSLATRFGILRPLLATAFLAAITNLLFAWMAGQGGRDLCPGADHQRRQPVGRPGRVGVHRLAVQPDQYPLHRHAVRPVQLADDAAGQVSQRIRRDCRGCDGLSHLFRPLGSAWPTRRGADPDHHEIPTHWPNGRRRNTGRWKIGL